MWRGEIQARGLGMDVEVFDDDGPPGARRERGAGLHEAVSVDADGLLERSRTARKYHAAYFERYPGVWRHGDYAELTEHDGLIIYGRSDATLNPGGVRIGTAEIYRQVEQIDEVVESLVVGQHWDHDERIVLFVRLREGARR